MNLDVIWMVGVVILLGICAVMDCMYQKVWMPLVAFMVFCILICKGIGGDFSWMEVLCGVGTGVFFYLSSLLTRGQIGRADAVLLGVLAATLDPWRGMGFVFCSLMAAFCVAVLLMAVWHKKRTTRMPMVPFMWVGYVMMLLL